MGSLLIGVLATTIVTDDEGARGLLYGGPVSLLGKQAVGVVAVMLYSFVVSVVLGFLINKTIGFRVKPEVEVEGVDIHEHAESGYDLAATGATSTDPVSAVVTAAPMAATSSASEASASERVSG